MANIVTTYIQKFQVQGEKAVIKANDSIKKSTKASATATKQYDNQMGQLVKTVGGFVLGAVAIKKALSFVGGSVELLRDDTKEFAKMEAVITATGGSAGLTGIQLKDMAQDIQDLTGVSNTNIISAQSMLLTFKEIGEEVFPRAIQAMVDMSAVQGSLEGNTLALGKALNDPISGVGALSRVGVKFTDQQKDQIKVLQESGDMMGAQKIILKELEGQFKGTASSMALNTDKLSATFGDFRKSFVSGLEPMIQEFSGFATTILKDNIKPLEQGVKAFAKSFKDNLDVDIKDFKLGDAFIQFSKDFGKVTAFIVNNSELIIKTLVAIGAGSVTKNIIQTSSSIITAIGAVGTAIIAYSLKAKALSTATKASFNLINSIVKANPELLTSAENVGKLSKSMDKFLPSLGKIAKFAISKAFITASMIIKPGTSGDVEGEMELIRNSVKNMASVQTSYYKGYGDYLKTVDAGIKKQHEMTKGYIEYQNALKEKTLDKHIEKLRTLNEVMSNFSFQKMLEGIDTSDGGIFGRISKYFINIKELDNSDGGIFGRTIKSLQEIKGLTIDGQSIIDIDSIVQSTKSALQLEYEAQEAHYDGLIALAEKYNADTSELQSQKNETLTNLDDEYYEKKWAKYTEDHAMLTAGFINPMIDSYDTLISTITDMDMTGTERREAIWTTAKESIVGGFGEILKDWAIKQITMKLISKGGLAETVLQSIVAGKAIASAYATSAALASLSSFGTNAIPATAGILSTVATSKGIAAFAKGGDFETNGAQLIMVGDNPGGRERVTVTPTSSPNYNGTKSGGGSNIDIAKAIQNGIAQGLANQPRYSITTIDDVKLSKRNDNGKAQRTVR